MKQSSKAALLSGLIFPGVGQLAILKRPKRGLGFLLPALASFGWLMYGLMKGTSALMDEALRGTLPPDPVAIAAKLTAASSIQGAELASWIIVACWLASLIDALFLRDQA